MPVSRFLNRLSRDPRHDTLLASPAFQFTLVILLALSFYFSKLGGHGLATWDDCYYAEKAKEILQTGDWLTMHYNREPIFDNPPFYMWLAALSFKIFGVTDYAAKFPSALMGVLTVALTFVLGRRWFDAWTGFFAAFVLAATPTFNKYARHAMLDVTLTFFVTLALFSLVLALEKDRRYFLLWGTAIAIGVLIKSVLGLFPLFISLAYLLLRKDFKIFLSPYFWCGIIIAFGLGGFWYLHQWLLFGEDFLRVHFGWLILQRGFQMQPEPWYAHLSYLKDLLIYYWPWLPLLLLGSFYMLRNVKAREPIPLLLMLWIASYLFILSAMQARRLWYLMPIFPAAAMVAAHALHRLLSPRAKLIFAQVVLAILIVANIVVNATPLQIESEREKDIRILAPYVRHFGEAGARVLGFRKDYYSLNNALLFYSDHAAAPIMQSPEELRAAIQTERTVLFVMEVSVWQALQNESAGLFVIKQADKLVLLANRALDASAVKTWQ